MYLARKKETTVLPIAAQSLWLRSPSSFLDHSATTSGQADEARAAGGSRSGRSALRSDARAMQAALHRVERDAERLCGLGRGEPFDVAERDDRPSKSPRCFATPSSVSCRTSSASVGFPHIRVLNR